MAALKKVSVGHYGMSLAFCTENYAINLIFIFLFAVLEEFFHYRFACYEKRKVGLDQRNY